ncbi:MAG: hypothetical protein U1F43_19900 [Myxococcota bacterium]
MKFVSAAACVTAALAALSSGLAAGGSSAWAADPGPAVGVGQTAKVLAGLATDDIANEVGEDKTLAKFAKVAVAKWALYQKNIGGPMARWATAELARTPGETVFYPFAGPDLPTAVALYPDAGRYVLVALQTGGRVPHLDAMTKKQLDAYLGLFERGWIDFARRGFFRTDDLKADTGHDRTLEGITPVLMAFAAASGFTVETVEPVRIKADGSDLEPNPASKDELGTWDSVRLGLRRADGKAVTLDYVFLDLSDGYLGKHAEAKAWVNHMASNRVFTKAASHLMQKSFFSIVKDALVTHAPSIVQDETGLDYKDLVKGFDVVLYGRFERAHKLWTEGVQRELATAYKTRTDLKPLKFKYGYEKDAGSCIQVATRKK